MQNLLPDICQLSEFYVFKQDIASTLRHASRHGRLQTSFPHDLAAKEHRLKSCGLHSVVSNAGEGLQKADQGRR